MVFDKLRSPLWTDSDSLDSLGTAVGCRGCLRRVLLSGCRQLRILFAELRKAQKILQHVRIANPRPNVFFFCFLGVLFGFWVFGCSKTKRFDDRQSLERARKKKKSVAFGSSCLGSKLQYLNLTNVGSKGGS